MKIAAMRILSPYLPPREFGSTLYAQESSDTPMHLWGRALPGDELFDGVLKTVHARLRAEGQRKPYCPIFDRLRHKRGFLKP
jgi:hypothetical protein